jgi:mono/diheme cytochrome c family protein
LRVIALTCLVSLGGAVGAAFGADNPGQKIFRERCVMCHQEDAHGAAGVAPSLAGTLGHYLASDAGRHYLAQILVSGMIGPIDTEGHRFSGLMPGFAADLSDADIAATINYTLGAYNGVSDASATAPIGPQDVAAARAANPVPTGTRALRQSLGVP